MSCNGLKKKENKLNVYIRDSAYMKY
uniref:Uncharacterized protein n=1 Tax=Rhizophora mucronata TaxID=61149 RepID=A0A2P2R266_RHIMU